MHSSWLSMKPAMLVERGCYGHLRHDGGKEFESSGSQRGEEKEKKTER